MSNEITTAQSTQLTGWKGTLEKAMPNISASLPAHVTPEKFKQVAATAIGRTPKLKECMESNPAKVLTALADCAKDGLLPDGREAALVPFGNSRAGTLDLNYIPMISGVLKRMRQSGEVTSLKARIVYENDEFEYIDGDEDTLTHKPNWKADRGKPVAAYAIIKLKSGEVYREVMSRSQIEAVKRASRAKNGPWSGPFEEEMWRKTVLKRAAKYVPFSDEQITQILDRDNALYDMDRANQPTPIESRFNKLRNEAARPRYGQEDEVPARDIADDIEEAEFTETDPLPVSNLGDSEEEISEHSHSEAVEGATQTSDDTSSSQPNSGLSEAQAFYHDAMGQMKKAKPPERAKLLDALSKNPLWQELTEGKIDQIIALSKGE